MKKIVVALAAVLAAGALAGGVGATADAGKLIDRGFACNVIDGNGSLFVVETSELWLYQHKSVLRCWGYGAPAAALTYWNASNWPPPEGGGYCGMLQFGLTQDFSDKVGTKGFSQLTCNGPTSPASASGGAGVGG